MNCGIALATAQNAEEAKAGGLNLDRYIPPELLTKLNSAQAHGGMAGERRVITILFCDIKGSTAAAEQLDPEEWTEIINNAFEHMIRPIYKYEGFVPRLMGDAILAFFGAPIAHEDDPQRAVLAALDIQSNIEPYSKQIREKHGIDFKIRVGINTGLVVVGEIGSDLRLEYTAIGDAINLAARMEQTAEPGTIQISEETYKLVAPFFEFKSLGESQIKGKAAPVWTFRVLAVKGTPGQLRGVEGLSSPLVGREAELALLEAQLEALSKGAGAFMAITGEAGLGKTSLIAKAHQQVMKDANINWLEGHALSYTQSVSYFPWRQVIRQAIGAQDNDTPSEVRQKLHYVCSCCSLPGGDTAFLEAMLAVESEQSLKEVSGYQGEALVQRMIDATRGYFCGLAHEAPLVIVLDDLHWMDAASLSLFTSLATLVEENPILFIGMLRPDQETASWRFVEDVHQQLHGGFRQIALEPLSQDKTKILLTSLLGAQELPSQIHTAIMEKAEGNPFFVEEIIRSLIETKQIVRENSHWKLTGEINKISLPNTLTGVLGARIDRLPEETKHILQIASVIGRSFDRRVLTAMDESRSKIEVHIQKLEQAGLIHVAQADAEAGFVFRHALVQDAAYNSILLKTRRELHQRIGNILEELYANRIEEFAPMLAHHFYAAGDARSLKYDLLAGEKAARLYANSEAATHFSRALGTAKQNVSDHAQIAQIFTQLGHVLELAGRHREALATYDEMLAFARERKEKSSELNALMAKATIYSIFSELHNSVLSEQMLVQALEVSAEIGDRVLQARLNWNLMINYLFSKRLDQAFRHGELALILARESNDREQLAFVLNDLCRLYTCRGEFEKAYAVIHEARDLWRILDNETMFVDSLGAESEARFNAGDYDKSLELSSQALAMSEKIENAWGQAYNRMLIGFVYTYQGEIGRAIQLGNEAVLLGDRASLLASTIGTRSDLAWLYGCYGAIEKGLELIEEALIAAETKQPDWKDLPLAIKVRLHLLNGDIDSAEQVPGSFPLKPISIPYARYTILICLANVEMKLARGNYDEALILVEDLLKEVATLTRPDVSEVMQTKGNILSSLGRFDEADQVLTQAWTMAEALGSKHELWPILTSLASLKFKLGETEEAKMLQKKAYKIVEEIAETLREGEMRESFLNQPRLRVLMQ